MPVHICTHHYAGALPPCPFHPIRYNFCTFALRPTLIPHLQQIDFHLAARACLSRTVAMFSPQSMQK